MSRELLMLRHCRAVSGVTLNPQMDCQLSLLSPRILCLPWPRRAGTCRGWPGGWWSSPCPGPGPPSPPPSASAPPRESSGRVLVLWEARGGRLSRLKHGKTLVKFECCAHLRLKYLFLLYFIICNLSRKLYSKSDKRNLLTREFIKYVNLTAMQRKFQEIFKYNLYIYWNFLPWYELFMTIIDLISTSPWD